MAKPLLVQTDRSPARKVPLGGTTGGIPLEVGIGANVLVHTVPLGYRDELHIWWNNNDAAADGFVLVEFDQDPNLSVIEVAPFRETTKPIDGMVIEADAADVEIDMLGITEPGLAWGYAVRTAISA